MLTGSRSTRRRQVRRRPVARSIVPLAIPMALGLALGVVIAVSGHSPVTRLSVSALGATGTATPGATVTPSADPANTDCELIVPADPLSATGLATPYQLTGPAGQGPAASGCEESDPDLQAFVQATILNPATGKLWVYEPLVVTLGSPAAVAPVVPKLPKNAEVDLMVGFNGGNLQLFGAQPKTLTQAKCVNGFETSLFGQVAYCNSTGFFAAADIDIASGKLRIPGNGTSPVTGQPCPTTRSFDLVDQDPSDNVTTEYLLNPATGQTAQDTTANAANLTGSTLLLNGSDNTLLDLFMDPVLGCTPFQAPDLANNNQPSSSQALDELLAAKNQPRVVALVPENDEMVLSSNNTFDQAKDDLYRAEVGQAPISNQNNQTSSPAMYCQNLVNIQTPFLNANQTLLATGQSPVTGTGDNLLTFLANRLSMSFVNLACQNFGLTNPVTVTLNGAGAAVAATFNTTQQKATNTGSQPSMPGSGFPGSHNRVGRRHHQIMNPSGM
jgi:hypothetical protein